MPRETIAEETTTLPEGAVISLWRCKNVTSKSTTTSTRLVAWRGDKRIEMKVDDVSPQHFRQYLDMTVREINRRRQNLTKKPSWAYDMKAQTIQEFVESMAYNDMFIFETLTEAPAAPETKGNNGASKERKQRKQRKPKEGTDNIGGTDKGPKADSKVSE